MGTTAAIMLPKKADFKNKAKKYTNLATYKKLKS